jgi:selenide,water dikinase
LRHLPKKDQDERLLVGLDTSDDGGVYQLTDDIALVQTVDYFTPIVDDPYMFGQIAAANALSDVYAMGGEPKTVLNIVGFPIKKLPHDVLAMILKGAADKTKEAGAVIAGGHSIDDQEPKFGLSCTGVVHPDRIFKNVGAKPGDKLILTKPLGVGILTTAIKFAKASEKQEADATNVMATLNKVAAEVLKDYHPHAVTDVTGFGLLGHGFEMASGSDISFEINYGSVPLIEGTVKHAKAGVIPGGSKSNHKWLEKNIDYDASLELHDQLILCDSITSGGLLISLPEEEAEAYIKEMTEKAPFAATVIGQVTEKKEKAIYVFK